MVIRLLSSRLQILLSGLFLFAALQQATAASEEKTPGTETVLIAFGDSLTAGYQLAAKDAFPAQLEMALAAKGYKVKVVNAGVSGDTAANGLDRIDWTLSAPADGVILELGANDALRGIDPAITRSNLEKLVKGFKAKGLDVLLAGMHAPENWGPDYKKKFDQIYPDLAKSEDLALHPYFLEGVRMNPALLQSDGLHPTAKGVAEIVKNILPAVEVQLKRLDARKTTAKP